MQPDFWHERWRTGRIGFHQPVVDRALAEFWPSLDLPAGSRVLVPMCGKSLDMGWLRTRGHAVIGVDVSDVALEAFCRENAIAAQRATLPEFDVYRADGFCLYRGDVLALTPALVGKVAGVYDRGALVAWEASMRGRYVDHLASLTAPGAATLLITLEYDQRRMAGPPFAVDAAEVRRLYGPAHSIRELSRRDALADEPRMRAKGVTELAEVCHRIVRLPP